MNTIPPRAADKNAGNITWLHLSDWHQGSKDFNRDVVRDLLMKDVASRETISPALKLIDFIIFSGDVAYHGKTEEYDLAVTCLFTPLLEASGLGDEGRERLFIVPGNHDVDRDVFAMMPNDLVEKISTSAAVADWLTDKRKRRVLLQPMADYAEFVSKFLGGYQNFKDYDLEFCSIKRLRIGNRSIAVLCLNSAWLSGHNIDTRGNVNDRGYLLLGEPQIHSAITQTSDADIRIAVLHHPFEWLNDFDRNSVEERLTKAFHFILCGHQHIPRVSVVQSPVGDYINIPAGASYDRRTPDDPRYANSYNFVSLDFDTGQGTIYFRRWSDRRCEWTADTDVAEEGLYRFGLPKGLGGPEPPSKQSRTVATTITQQSERFLKLKQFETDLREWLVVCGHQLESSTDFQDDGFVFISNEPITGGYDRIAVLGVEGEATAVDVSRLTQFVEDRMAHRGWLISMRRITPFAREATDLDERLRSYTFDELVDQKANFDKYFQWLENEYTRRGLDRYYINISCSKDDIDPETGDKLGTSKYDNIDDYIGQWLDDPFAEHISILGEFGTGKTWFCLHYAHQALQAYKKAKAAGRQRPRLPLLIQLRDFRSMEVETLFSDFFFRKFEIGLPGYTAYQQLNRMGKLLLVFDGFDEMADRTNRQKQIDNFWALVRAVGPGAKALLTCRKEHFEFAKAAVGLLRGEEPPTFSPDPRISLAPPRFEILNLEKLSSDQITEIVVQRQGDSEGRELAARILSVPELADLAKRASLIEFIVAALPSLLKSGKIDLARVFLYATRDLLLKNIREKRSFTSMADKVHFLCELAWEMLSGGELKINFSQFPDRLRQYRPELKDREIDHWKFDIEAQSLLIRDDNGNYSFSHKSLPEYFVAYKLIGELGLISPNSEWITSYFPAARKSSGLLPRLWEDFFKCPSDISICGEYFQESSPVSSCPSSGGTCMSHFRTSSFEKLVSTFGEEILTPEVVDFMVCMAEDIEPLWRIIDSTKDKSVATVQYAGGNAATLLNRLNQSFANRNLKLAVLDGADLTSANLNKANLSGASLRDVTLNHSNLAGANLSGADLSDAIVQELNPAIAIAWSPDGQAIASLYSDYQLRLWSTKSWSRWRNVDVNAKKPRSICWAPSGQHLYVTCDNGIGLIRTDRNDEFTLYPLTARATHIDVDFTGQFLAARMTSPYHQFYSNTTLRAVSILNMNVGTWMDLASTSGSLSYPTAIRFSIDMNLLFIGKYHGTMHVFDTNGRAGRPRKVFEQSSVTAISANRGGVICGSRGGEIRFLNNQLRPLGYSLPDKYKEKIVQIDTNLRSGHFAILDESGKLDVWDQERKRILDLSSSVETWKSFAFNPNGTQLAASTGSAIHVFDIDLTSPGLGHRETILGQAINCERLLLQNAKGLDSVAPSGKGTMREWFNERGAII